MRITHEPLPSRTIHVLTIHQDQELSSLVKVSRDFEEEQMKVAKEEHRTHFKITPDDYIEIYVRPIDEWEFNELRNKIITLNQ